MLLDARFIYQKKKKGESAHRVRGINSGVRTRTHAHQTLLLSVQVLQINHCGNRFSLIFIKLKFAARNKLHSIYKILQFCCFLIYVYARRKV